MENEKIEIVDRGRGMQLSTSRITVQDLVPHFIAGESYEEIRHCMPVLNDTEIQVVESYFREHEAELRAEEREITERAETRRNAPEVEAKLAAGILRLRADMAARKAMSMEVVSEGVAR